MSGLARPGVPTHPHTSGLVTQSWHLLSRKPAPRAVNRARALGSAAPSCTRSHGPVLRCPGAADHQDPVMTSYLPLTCRSNPGPGAGAPAWRGSLPGVPVPLEPAEAPRGGSLATAASGPGAAVRATSAARLAPVQKFSHKIMVRRLQHPPMSGGRHFGAGRTRQSPESGNGLSPSRR